MIEGFRKLAHKAPFLGAEEERYLARRAGAGDPRLENGDTIYLTTADSSGMMVSWIQSNFRGLGSGVCPPINE